MAPLAVSGRDTPGEQKHERTSTIWVSIAIAVICLAFFAVLGAVLVKRLRGSPYRSVTQIARRTSEPAPLPKRKSSMLDIVDDESEMQRQYIIRKSLASRASSRAASLAPSRLYQPSLENLDMEEDSSGSLKNDWKQWEARLHYERSRSSESHPATSVSLKRTSSNATMIAVGSALPSQDDGPMSPTSPEPSLPEQRQSMASIDTTPMLRQPPAARQSFGRQLESSVHPALR